MGAGVIGVTTAYFLAKSGHQVTVLEKNSASSLGCSYANGGQLSYSHFEPFASKTSLPLIAKAFFTPNSFLSIKSFADRNFIKWSFDFFKNCNEETTNSNSKKLCALGNYSRNSLHEVLENEENIKFDYNDRGILHFYRNEKLFQKALKHAEFQQSLGVKLHILNSEECLKKEPTLVKLYDEKKLVGGIFYDSDESGNSLLFTKTLEKICQEKYGVVFEYGAEIKNIFTNHVKITGVHTTRGVFTANKYVYALGAYGNKVLRGIGVESKIYPLKGYSLSIEANDEFIAPAMALTDVENKIVYSRLGNIFRAAGAVESCGLRGAKNTTKVDFLHTKIRATFSDFGNVNNSKEWCGFRPFRPNSIPLVGEVKKYGNLYINAGHGHLGWTLSCGSAKILANLMNGADEKKFAFLQDEFA